MKHSYKKVSHRLGGKHICQRENWKYADLFTKSSKTNNVLSSVNEMRKFVLENEENSENPMKNREI